MNLTAFRLMLPVDGTHHEVIQRAIDAGLPFSITDGDRVINLCAAHPDDEPALGYTIDLPCADDLERVAKRLLACAKLAQGGDGIVPDKAPPLISGFPFPRGKSDREKLVRMRDLFRLSSDAIEGLLEATQEGGEA